MAAKQLTFEIKGFKKPKDHFGGSLLKGNNPKSKRPLDSKFPIHLVLKAKKGGMRLHKTFRETNAIVTQTAKKHGVKIYRYANVGNHLHLVIKLTKIQKWAAFIRELAGRIAALMRACGITIEGESFWLFRPFTRIVRSWKKAYKDVCEYVHLNFLEAEGFIKRSEIKTLKELHALWKDP